MTAHAPDQGQLRLLAEADLLMLLGRWLAAPPSRPNDVTDLLQLERASGFASESTPIVDLAICRSLTSLDDWVAEHNRLFEGGVSCPPNETAYVRRDKGVILADIAGFYRAFGFEPAAGTGEKPDHIIAELQFMALLLVMTARAADERRSEDQATTRRALAAFAADHLGAWIDLFSRRLVDLSRLSCFIDLGALILTSWGLICAHHGLEPPDNEPAADDPSNQGNPYECDLCAPG